MRVQTVHVTISPSSDIKMSFMVIFLVIAGAHVAYQIEELVIMSNGWPSPPAEVFHLRNPRSSVQCKVKDFFLQSLPLELSVVQVHGDGTREKGQPVGNISVTEKFAANGQKLYSATQTFSGLTFYMCSDSLICRETKSLNLMHQVKIAMKLKAPEVLGNGNVSEKGSASLTCKAGCTDDVTYTWCLNGVCEPVSHQSAVKVIPHLSLNDNGNEYSCKLSRHSAESPISSTNITLNVQLAAPTVEGKANGIIGSNVVLTCSYPGNASNIVFTWYRDGQRITGSSTFITPVLRPEDDRQLFACQFTVGSDESYISDPVELRVKEYYLSLRLGGRTAARQGSVTIEPGIHMLVCSIEGLPWVVSPLEILARRAGVSLTNCSNSTASFQNNIQLERKTMNCTINVTVDHSTEKVGCELDQPQVSSNETYVVQLLVRGAECGFGRYGDYCNWTCGKCAHNHTCDRNTGYCRGCEPGWLPPTCLQRCRAGTYGRMCFKRCGHCLNYANCHHVTGFCLECEPGWNGTACHNCESAIDTGTIETPVVQGKHLLVVGDRAELTCFSVNTRGATYQWYADGSLIRDVTSMNYSIFPVTLKDNGRQIVCSVTVGLITSDPSADTVYLDVKSMRIWFKANDEASQVNQIQEVQEGLPTVTCWAEGVQSEVINLDIAVMLDNLTLTDCVRKPGDLKQLPCNITLARVQWTCPVQLKRTGHTINAQCVDLGDTVSPAHATLSVFAYRLHSRLRCPPDWQSGQWITLSCVISFLKTTNPNVSDDCIIPRSHVRVFFWQKATSTNEISTAYDPKCSAVSSSCNFTSVSRGCGCTVGNDVGASVFKYTFVTNTSFNGWWRCGTNLSCLASDINSTRHSAANCDGRVTQYRVKEKKVSNLTPLWIFVGLFGAMCLLVTVSLCCNYHHHKHTCPGCCFAFQVDNDDQETEGWDGRRLSIRQKCKRNDTVSQHEVIARKLFYYLGCLLPVSGAIYIASGGEMCSQHWAPCGKDTKAPRQAGKPADSLAESGVEARPVAPWKRKLTASSGTISLKQQPSVHVRWSEQVWFELDEKKSDQGQQKDEDNAGAEQSSDKGQPAHDPDFEGQGGERRLDGADKDAEGSEMDNEDPAQQQGMFNIVFQ